MNDSEGKIRAETIMVKIDDILATTVGLGERVSPILRELREAQGTSTSTENKLPSPNSQLYSKLISLENMLIDIQSRLQL